MSSEAAVTLQVEGGVAEIRLANGDAGNTITEKMARDFAAVLDEVEARVQAGDGSVRAILLVADGPAFTFGGDIGLFVENLDGIEEVMFELARLFNELVLRVAEIPVPVVTAVQGAAAGGGLGLAWAADLLYCSPEARFAPAFDRIGYTGDGGGTWYLPRLIGLRRAQLMTVGGKVVDGKTAVEWGLANELVDGEELYGRARSEAERLAAGPTKALAMTSDLLRGSFNRTLAEQLALEAQCMGRAGATQDGKEGPKAFLEKRRPDFRGA